MTYLELVACAPKSASWRLMAWPTNPLTMAEVCEIFGVNYYRAWIQDPRKRRLKVAMKINSMKRPITASAAPSRATQSPSGSEPGKKPRP